MLRRIAALILAALFLLSAVCYAAVRITIKSEAVITGPQITLGQIAVIEGDETSRITALQQIPLGSAPLPGASALLTRDVLTARLSASQTDFGGLEWNPIPETVRISTGGQLISGQALSDIALAKLRQKLPSRPDEEITVSLLKPIPDLMVPLGDLHYGIVGQSVRFGVPLTAYLTVSTDAVLYTRIPIKYELKRFSSVLVTNTTITARQTLAADLFRLDRLDVSRLSAGYLTNFDQTAGLVAKRSLPAGTVVYPHHLEKPVLIKRGSPVTITVVYGGVEAVAPGVAQKDGHDGQLIPVRNTLTGRLVTARVVAKDRVEVILIKR